MNNVSVILSCGCDQGDPSQWKCDNAISLYDALRKSREIYEGAREVAAMAENASPEYQEKVYTVSYQARDDYQEAQKQFRQHYRMESR